MSSDIEEDDLNYGINDDDVKSFGKDLDHDDEEETRKNLDFSNVEQKEESCVARYEKNPKLKPVESDESETPEECGLEDLLNLIEQENNDEEEEEEQNEDGRKKIFLKKEKPSQSAETVKSPESKPISKSSITITKIPKESPTTLASSSNLEERILTEKNTSVRLVKSSFKNDVDLNMRLACDFGKFIKLADIYRRTHELKEAKDFKWYSIFLLISKTESKCSAKGNNYVIWKLVDVSNLDKHQEISLFLFGNAYKSHWKSNEFEVFALIQPDILDSNNNNNQNNSKPANPQQTNSVFSNGSPYNRKTSQNNSWNKFAAKKVDLNNKLSLSVKSDHQLIPLGFSKDITMCQSTTVESSKRCKNLVNLQEAPFCIYHCKQIDSKNKFGVNTKGKYSMAQPTNRFGSPHLFESSLSQSNDVKFVPNSSNTVQRNQLMQKAADLETRAKLAKEFKAEALNSLNSSIKDSSSIVSQIAVKTAKKSDLELLASLEGKQLDKEEIKKIRLAEQASVKHYSNTNNEQQKELKKLFNSKLLLPNETTCNSSISSKRLHEYKQSQTQALERDANGGAGIKLSPFDYSAKLKEKYEDNKKNFTLSTMGSHKDIVKQIKEKDTNKPAVETKPVVQPTVNASNKSIIAAEFLAKRVSEIKSSKASQENKATTGGFDLELYIGDSLTTKKLLDVNSKYIPHSPATATSTGYKRKLDEIKQASPSSPSSVKPSETAEDKKAKKLKMIDEILSIKSNHLKEVNDPEKNPHVKSYFNKLEQQESVENKLCSVRNREIRAVTCKVCSYTSFSQSDYCKKQNHVITRHMALQRFFKCKICSKRTYTLDKVCPVSACSQCGNEKFEPCTMKDEDLSISKSNDNLNLESEMLLEA